jgi:hypothetical protein
MKIIEIENAIPRLYQDQVELEATSSDIPWFYHRESARTDAGFATSYGGFSHLAYHHREPTTSAMGSSLIPMLFMFCDKANLALDSILRIRLGLFTKNGAGAPHHNPHIDFTEPHYTAVYYVNDSDGDTFIFDETHPELSQADAPAYAAQNKFTVARRVTPKKGKVVCFDGRHYHASMHPTKSETRVAITFNFR